MMSKKRIFLSIFYVLLGIGLNGAHFAGLVDEFWCGIGTAFIIVGILQLLRWLKYYRNEEYREKVEVEAKDERNRYLAMKAWAWAGYFFVLICGLGCIILRIMGQEMWSLAASYGVCLIILLYWASYLFLRRKY